MTVNKESSKSRIPVIAIIDVGKTNKKFFLFDQHYKIIYERTAQLPETTDEDGFPCEDVETLTHWVEDEIRLAQHLGHVVISAINVAAYGASFVHLDIPGKPIGNLYNYLKPYPNEVLQFFLSSYDQNHSLSLQTSSPQLGSLNSGLQLYRLKCERLPYFNQIKYSLHLPHYISYLLTNTPLTECTSLGCHTMLWDFKNKKYHQWVIAENIHSKFPQLVPSDHVTNHGETKIGVGLHDSSAALIPYLESFREPFALLSTGTWCISLNPFNQSPLTEEELELGCLQYLSYKGTPVKASRLFAGHEHELMMKKIAAHFSNKPEYFHSVPFDKEIAATLMKRSSSTRSSADKMSLQSSGFDQRNLSAFASPEEAYHQLLLDLVQQQLTSTGLVLKNTPVKKIFVDGGFSSNTVYLNLLAAGFRRLEIYSTSVPQASALGAALAIHASWNNHPIPPGIITLRHIPPPNGLDIRSPN